MDAKDESHVDTMPEKGPSSPSSDEGDIITVRNAERPGLMTRLGLTKESFQQRTLAEKHNQLNRTLKARHLNMIAIGGSIGAGLFVGSGGALAAGGPAALLIDFAIIGLMMIMVVYALGELCCLYPVDGGFYTFSIRFIDPSWGMAMGYNYVFQWAIVLPLELTVAGLTVNYWGADVNVAVWITVFYVAIIVINVFGVLGYAEEEFWVAGLKLITIVVFMVIALVFVCGGGPSRGKYDEYWGAKLWYNPGAFSDGFFGVCSVFVTAAFSFSGTELVGLAAAESENPQKHLPRAVKQVFWRVTLFYILALFFVGLLIPYNDERLLGEGLIDVSASPFVIVAVDGGIPAFGDFVNVVILLAVISIGLSGVYGGSRTLTALGDTGYAPKIFAYVDRAGRPLWSTLLVLAFGPIAYVALASSGVEVFAWLQALSGLAALFTWGSICLAHIRFRQAWKYHGHTLDELPFKSPFGIWGSALGLTLNILVLIAQFYTAVKPMDATAFFKSYLAAFVVILFYAIAFFWKHEGFRKLSQIDVDSGRREVDHEAHRTMLQRKADWPMWRRALYYLY